MTLGPFRSFSVNSSILEWTGVPKVHVDNDDDDHDNDD